MWRRLVIALVVCSVGLSAFGAYGLSGFDPAHLDRLASAAFVPVNGTALRLDLPGEPSLLFERDAEDPEHVLSGPSPWVAELDGRTARVMTDPDFKGGQTGFMFVDGRLRGLLVDGREYQVPAPVSVTNATSLARLWPADAARRRQVEAPDIWKDSGRLRLWFDNPNKAGLLFAELALALLALVFRRRRTWVRACGAAGALLAFGCLVWTSSRGGFLAFLCGLGMLGLLRFRRLCTRRNLILLASVVLVAVGGLFASGQGGRLVGKLFTEERTTAAQRATSRLTIWREVPRMIVDAPGGWGAGKSAEAYIDWYQKEGGCLLKDMISGHLTYLVEHGWFARSAYLLLWSFFLLFSVLRGFRGDSPFPAAVGVAFFVGACFNPVVAEWTLWVLPLAFAVPVARAVARRARRRQVYAALAGAALCVVVAGGGIALAARGFGSAGSTSVARTGETVRLNGADPAVWLVDDDYVLHGGFWWLRGAEIRAHLGANRPLGYARAVGAVPKSVRRLVLVGEAGRDYLALPAAERPQAQELVFLSPPFTWRDVPADLCAGGSVSLVCGGVAVQAAGLQRKDAPAWVRIVPGAGLYIPDWTKTLSL